MHINIILKQNGGRENRRGLSSQAGIGYEPQFTMHAAVLVKEALL